MRKSTMVSHNWTNFNNAWPMNGLRGKTSYPRRYCTMHSFDTSCQIAAVELASVTFHPWQNIQLVYAGAWKQRIAVKKVKTIGNVRWKIFIFCVIRSQEYKSTSGSRRWRHIWLIMEKWNQAFRRRLELSTVLLCLQTRLDASDTLICPLFILCLSCLFSTIL